MAGGMSINMAEAGKPEPWGIGLQEAATPTMEQLTFLHNDILMPIVTAIAVFVLGLLVYTCWRFRESRHPTPSTRTHNTALEIIWTAIPVVILIFIGFFSFPFLYWIDNVPEAKMTVKVTGLQWYWTYEYPDHDNLTFDSYMIGDSDIQPNQLRNLEVDNRMVVPVDTTIRVQITAADVIHSWAIPAFGIKTDAIPGRLNETWFHATRVGTFYGQCSEICGSNHAYMPVTVEVVEPEIFERWVRETREQLATRSIPFEHKPSLLEKATRPYQNDKG